MKIVALEAFVVRIPLVKPVKHASHTRSNTDNLVVKATLDNGIVGWGEGVPREYVTGETASSALEQLRQSELGKQISECDQLPEILQMIEAIRVVPQPNDVRGISGNAARCAVELALLDAYGKALQIPLSEMTKTLSPNLYEPRSLVRYSGAITSARRGMKIRLAAWRMRIFGVKQIKVKVGIDGYDDPYRLRMIRRRVGKSVDIRIDANEAWSASEAGAKIRALEPYRISAVEQPIPHEQAHLLPQLQEEISTPIMLDESCCGMYDAQQAVENKWCQLFNIRLSKLGGFIPAIRLAEFAAAHNIGYQLGCQVGETAILSAAGRHFATSVKNIRYLEGSYDRHLVRKSLSEEDITFGWGGVAPEIRGNGLGIAISEQQVQECQTAHERLI
jgi:muconate cycloisomerase